jgi:uncharacterized protein involved in response to NO
MALSAVIGPAVTALIDGAFLMGLAGVALREIVAGKNWRNLRVLVVIGVLIAGNVAFHVEWALSGRADYGIHVGIAAVIALITLIGRRPHSCRPAGAGAARGLSVRARRVPAHRRRGAVSRGGADQRRPRLVRRRHRLMTLAMTRASLGHTGQALAPSPATQTIYARAGMAAVLRIAAAFVPSLLLLDLSALAFVAAFGGFAVVYGPLLAGRPAGWAAAMC